MARSAASLTDVIDSVLDAAVPCRAPTCGRSREERKGGVDAADVVTDVVVLLQASARARGVTLRSDVGERNSIRTDRAILRRMLVNLASNAIAATASGGEVSVSVRFGRVASPNGDLSTMSNSDGDSDSVDCAKCARGGGPIATSHDGDVGIRVTAIFEVEDTGPGMSPQGLERFVRTGGTTPIPACHHREGPGMGLMLVARMARGLGARVGYAPRMGGGSRFVVDLPTRIVAPGENDEVAHDVARTYLRGARVLVVDDNEGNRTTLSGMLLCLGAIPTACGGSAEALMYIDAGHTFDLALLDLRMPSVSGLDLAPLLRQRRSDMPLVLVASVGSLLCSHTWRTLSLFEHQITKPTTIAKVLDAVCACAASGPLSPSVTTPTSTGDGAGALTAVALGVSDRAFRTAVSLDASVASMTNVPEAGDLHGPRPNVVFFDAERSTGAFVRERLESTYGSDNDVFVVAVVPSEPAVGAEPETLDPDVDTHIAHNAARSELAALMRVLARRTGRDRGGA